MNRYTAFLTAAVLLCGLCSCEDKPDNSEPVDVTAPVTAAEDIPADGGMTALTELPPPELTDADFAPVDIAMDKTDTAPPVEPNSLDLSGFDFGERRSPCKDKDLYEKYLNNVNWTMEGVYNYVDEPDTFLEKKCEGMFQSGVFLDGKFYIAVNFDDLCGCHDSSLYSIDAETGEIKELVRHTGLEYNSCFKGLTTAHGRLIYCDTTHIGADNEESCIYYMGSDDIVETILTGGSNTTSVYSIAPESGTEEKLFDIGTTVFGMAETEKGFFLHKAVTEQISDESRMGEYDFTTGELHDYEPPEAVSTETEYLCDGVPAEVTGGFDGEKWVPIIVKTQYYTLSTDLVKFSGLYLWKDMVCIVEDNDYSRDYLHTYDIKSREHLKMKFDAYSGGWGDDFQTVDALMMIGAVSTTDMGYSYQSAYKLEMLIPKLGTVYTLERASQYVKAASGDTLYLLGIGQPERSDEGFSTGRGLPEKLYWFE